MKRDGSVALPGCSKDDGRDIPCTEPNPCAVRATRVAGARFLSAAIPYMRDVDLARGAASAGPDMTSEFE